MKAHKTNYLFLILTLMIFGQACKEEAPKKSGNTNITDPYVDPYANGVGTSNGVPYITVSGAVGSSVSVALNTPATVNFSISNASNVQSILTASPVGSQLSGNTTLNPSLYWATPTQGVHTVTILARNMTLCESVSGVGNCQLTGIPVANPSYDATTTVTINVGSTTSGIDPTTGLPYPTGIDPTTGLPYPTTGNLTPDMLSQLAGMLGIDVSMIQQWLPFLTNFNNN